MILDVERMPAISQNEKEQNKNHTSTLKSLAASKLSGMVAAACDGGKRKMMMSTTTNRTVWDSPPLPFAICIFS
jgi:hypothetical protein